MPELTVTLRVPLPKQPTLAALERAIFKVVQAGGRELLLQAFSSIEDHVNEGAKQRRRRRYLITRFGEIRFHRWQTRMERGYGCPLDEALGSHPASRARPGSWPGLDVVSEEGSDPPWTAASTTAMKRQRRAQTLIPWAT